MKKHLLTKKRALISSVAMLLVAIIALGTATFAWFTQNTSAYADKLSVKTIKASELEVSSVKKEWSDHIEYGCNDKLLKPASSVNGTNWFTAVAKKQSSYEPADGNATEVTNNLGDYVFKDQLNVRNKGKVPVYGVKIHFKLNENQGGGDGKYLRLALVPTNKRGADAEVTAKNFQDNVFAAQADSATALGDVEKTPAKMVEISAQSGADGVVEVGNLAAADDTAEGAVSAKYYNLYVWFEGQDTDCKNANSGNWMPEITFTVDGDTVKPAENPGV